MNRKEGAHFRLCKNAKKKKGARGGNRQDAERSLVHRSALHDRRSVGEVEAEGGSEGGSEACRRDRVEGVAVHS